VRLHARGGQQDTENQLRQLRAYCEQRDYDVAGVYKDNESGRKGRAEREAFDQMFTDASKGQFDLVLFWSLDRFSREGISQTIHYLRQLESYDVHFNSYTELSPENELVRSILLSTLAYFARATNRSGSRGARRPG
jgi:DNA invertase Pin-like site-specific DNA recombinase